MKDLSIGQTAGVSDRDDASSLSRRTSASGNPRDVVHAHFARALAEVAGLVRGPVRLLPLIQKLA